MTAASCPRLFEVEAARDGRLVGPELARFRSHLSRCAVCSAESRALASLGASLRNLPEVPTDELHTRRQRTRLLASFDESLLFSQRSRKRWPAVLAVAAALMVLGLGLTRFGMSAPSAAPAGSSTAEEAIAIVAAPATQWSRKQENHREIVTLTAGTLSISVDHARSPRRLRVSLPDGDLEDIGTTFSVTVTGSVTSHVEVRHGAVILRLRGREPVVLGANESWTPSGPIGVSTSSPAPSTAPAPIPPPAVAAAPQTPPPRPVHEPARAPASAPARELTPTPSATAEGDRAATDFRAALSALNAGDPARAAAAFAAFLTSYPGDPRAEDASYLRVIALQRSGDAAATRSAAQRHLKRYPGAFRRVEVEALAR